MSNLKDFSKHTENIIFGASENFFQESDIRKEQANMLWQENNKEIKNIVNRVLQAKLAELDKNK